MMKPLRIAILFQSSLFAAGIASRLVEAGFTDVNLLNISQLDSTEKVKAQQPEVIIYDVSDLSVTKNLCIFSILRELPGVQVLQVDYIKEEVQIFCSQQKNAHKMDEFITLMQDITVSME